HHRALVTGFGRGPHVEIQTVLALLPRRRVIHGTGGIGRLRTIRPERVALAHTLPGDYRLRRFPSKIADGRRGKRNPFVALHAVRGRPGDQAAFHSYGIAARHPRQHECRRRQRKKKNRDAESASRRGSKSHCLKLLSNCLRKRAGRHACLGVTYTQTTDCRIKNVNYQRSVEAAVTTAMEVTASNPSDAKSAGIKRRKDFSSPIPNATSCCHYNKDKDKSIDENYFLQGTSLALAGWCPLNRPTSRSDTKPGTMPLSIRKFAPDQSGMLLARC